jgi:hypothetical protein
MDEDVAGAVAAVPAPTAIKPVRWWQDAAKTFGEVDVSAAFAAPAPSGGGLPPTRVAALLQQQECGGGGNGNGNGNGGGGGGGGSGGSDREEREEARWGAWPEGPV